MVCVGLVGQETLWEDSSLGARGDAYHVEGNEKDAENQRDQHEVELEAGQMLRFIKAPRLPRFLDTAISEMVPWLVEKVAASNFSRVCVVCRPQELYLMRIRG